jgi:ribosomal protein S27AE
MNCQEHNFIEIDRETLNRIKKNTEKLKRIDMEASDDEHLSAAIEHLDFILDHQVLCPNCETMVLGADSHDRFCYHCGTEIVTDEREVSDFIEKHGFHFGSDETHD